MPPAHRLRLRFTLLYGAVSLLSGMTLLAIVFMLARGLPPADAPMSATEATQPGGVAGNTAAYLGFRADALRVAGLALAVMVPVSLAFGWMFAGRMLRPVRTMTVSLFDRPRRDR
jgi:hypothetical protein